MAERAAGGRVGKTEGSKPDSAKFPLILTLADARLGDGSLPHFVTGLKKDLESASGANPFGVILDSPEIRGLVTQLASLSYVGVQIAALDKNLGKKDKKNQTPTLHATSCFFSPLQGLQRL